MEKVWDLHLLLDSMECKNASVRAFNGSYERRYTDLPKVAIEIRKTNTGSVAEVTKYSYGTFKGIPYFHDVCCIEQRRLNWVE